MKECNVQIAWPSKLKIGAKSKKGLGGCYCLILYLVCTQLLISQDYHST